MLQNGFKEERNSMDVRIKQLQAEIERERDVQDKIRDEARQAQSSKKLQVPVWASCFFEKLVFFEFFETEN